jgi:two-component system response regulator RpfG
VTINLTKKIFILLNSNGTKNIIPVDDKDVIDILGRCILYKDTTTELHSIKVSQYARLIAESMQLPKEECQAIEQAATLHDIGKIGIPDAVLLKPGKLTKSEFEIIKTHTSIGARILSSSKHPVMQLGATIAIAHHEKYDGSGYPNQLIGDDIPLAGRIVAVADVFDSLSSKRPYKNSWGNDAILSLFQEQSGKHFDPECVQAFLNQWEQVLKIEKYSIETKNL